MSGPHASSLLIVPGSTPSDGVNPERPEHSFTGPTTNSSIERPSRPVNAFPSFPALSSPEPRLNGVPRLPTIIMKVLVVADVEERSLYDHFRPERWAKAGIELVISCGDLKLAYLDFLASMFNVPCFYVRGNHDTAYGAAGPAGWVNLDGRLERHGGFRFYGLEGSPWYNGGEAQYTESQMEWRSRWARLTNWTSGIDVIVTHAAPRICPNRADACPCVYPTDGTPPRNPGQQCRRDPDRMVLDMGDIPHRPFEALRTLVTTVQPRFLLHGHMHLGYGVRPREIRLGNTRVIDAYGHIVIDL